MAGRLTNVGSRPQAYGPTEWALTLALGLIWGSAFLWIALGVDHLHPGVVAAGRVALGAAALALFPKARVRIAREHWIAVFAIAIFGNAGPALLFAFAETDLDSAVAGMITSSAPLFTLFIASLMLRSLPRPAQAIGITLGLTGTVMMALPSLGGARAAPVGVALVVLATIGYAIAANLLVPLQQRYGGPAVIMWALVISTVLLAPYGVMTAGESEFELSAVLAVVILGVMGTGIARALSATLAGRVGGPRMTTSTFMVPVVAIGLGVLFRDEVISPLALVGVVVVLAGAYLASRAVADPS